MFEFSRFCLRLALCFATNRERRRTISERSSVVSDLSYTSDLDLEMPSTSDGVVDETPVNEITNGVDASTLVRIFTAESGTSCLETVCSHFQVRVPVI